MHSIRQWMVGLAVGLGGLVASAPSTAAFVDLSYQVVSLGTPGRYEYRYTITNTSLASPLSWFSVDFSTSLYEESTLAVTSTGTSDWAEQILGSVLGNPAQYDAYRTVGAGLGIGQSFSGFAVAFTWLGAGTPGAQAFTVYDAGT